MRPIKINIQIYEIMEVQLLVPHINKKTYLSDLQQQKKNQKKDLVAYFNSKNLFDSNVLFEINIRQGSRATLRNDL